MDRTIEIEELLGEAGWLRRLAASLVGDGAQAEDLVQDTWVAALRRPPHADGEPRPWLARVARNLARNARRERERREARESFAHEERAHAEPGALAQEAEAQRLLAEAVTRLPEPLRAVIVLRYFQGLDSSAVAARLGVPASTVRTRLQRALEELRADLDRRFEGGRRAWGLLLVPLLRDAPSAATVIGSWPLWVACAGAACALAVVGVSSWASEDVREENAGATIVAHGDAQTYATAPESTSLSLDARIESERVAGSPSSPGVAAATTASEVSGIVLVDGRPPEWPIRLSLEPALLPELVLAPEQRGAFSFDDLSPGWSGRLRVDGYRFADGESSIVLDAPVSGLVLELRSGPAIVGRIVSPDGVPMGDLQGEYQLSSGNEGGTPLEIHLEGFLARADGSFRIPLLTGSDWGTVTIRVESEDLGYLQHESARFTIATGLDLGELVLEPLRPLEFTVRDPSGAPIADAIARVEGPGLSNRPPPLTRADGSGVLAVVPNRTVNVRFGAFGHRDRVMSAEPGKRLEVVLEPLAVLDVRLIGATAARATRFRLSADRSAFVWDDDRWGANPTFQFEFRGARPNRRTTPAAPGQRFEYEFHVSPEGWLQLVGLRTDLAITVEALDEDGRSIDARVVTVEVGRRAALDLGVDR